MALLRPKKADSGSSGYNWLDTYADMVTLLLTFFVLLYSMSSIDSEKWKKIVEAFVGQNRTVEQVESSTNPSFSTGTGTYTGPTITSPTAPTGYITEVKEYDDLYYYLKQYVQEHNLNDDVFLHKSDGYTFITFNNNIFFDGDSAELRPQSKVILDVLANAIKNISDQIGEIRAYGHTARAGGKDQPNKVDGDRTLSVMRANNVIVYLQKKNVIDPKKMVAEGYGEFRPIVPHDGTEATRIKNRRVEIYISKSDHATVTLDKIYEDIRKAQQQAEQNKNNQ